MINHSLLTAIIVLIFTASVYGQQGDLTGKKIDRLYPSKEVVTRYHNTWAQKHYYERIKTFKKEPLEKGEIIFIGNSITEQGRDWSKRFGIDHIRNRGIAGDVTNGVLERMDEIVYFQPNAVFILIGVNDLFNIHHELEKREIIKYDKIIPSAEFVGKNILKIARKLHRKLPTTKIYVRTVMPTRRDFMKEEILVINSILQQHQDDGIYTLIDFYTLFVDDNGNLTKELTKDGVHLNEAGYQKWVEFEKPILLNLSSNYVKYNNLN